MMQKATQKEMVEMEGKRISGLIAEEANGTVVHLNDSTA